MSSPPDQAMLREGLRGVTDEHTYGGIVSFMRRRYSRDLAEA
ncbi:MAG: agmatinase, partial [Gammaproteobacteria bacterium]|nr:agmatinase [Gammaproteobacteria bacterium]